MSSRQLWNDRLPCPDLLLEQTLLLFKSSLYAWRDSDVKHGGGINCWHEIATSILLGNVVLFFGPPGADIRKVLVTLPCQQLIPRQLWHYHLFKRITKAWKASEFVPNGGLHQEQHPLVCTWFLRGTRYLAKSMPTIDPAENLTLQSFQVYHEGLKSNRVCFKQTSGSRTPPTWKSVIVRRFLRLWVLSIFPLFCFFRYFVNR